MFEVIGFDASDPLAVVRDLCPWFDQSVENDVPVEVYDADASEPITLLCQNSFAV